MNWTLVTVTGYKNQGAIRPIHLDLDLVVWKHRRRPHVGFFKKWTGDFLHQVASLHRDSMAGMYDKMQPDQAANPEEGAQQAQIRSWTLFH